MKKEEVNYTRYIQGQQQGHYESFFVRANHPTLPQAFWIRYTIFTPLKKPDKAIAEVWAIYFDGTTNHHVAVKEEIPFAFGRCVFDTGRFFVRIDDAVLKPNELTGAAGSNGNSMSWNLKYEGNEEPLFVFPEKLYEGSFPKAKLLVGLPMAVFSGTLKVNETMIDVTGWVGSQNHNWGVKHTDHYAWGQVAGFDNFPKSFLEVSTARLKLGPVWTPFMTLLVLRHNGEEFRLNTIPQALKAKGSFNYFNWHFHSKTQQVEITGEIKAERENFVGLKYYNPPGGIKHCLNTKIASCKIEIIYIKASGKRHCDILETKNRAAFEILTDDTAHGIEISV